MPHHPVALGHGFQPRNVVWPVSIAFLLAWWLLIFSSLGPRQHWYSILTAARAQMENSLLAYDSALESHSSPAWWSRLIWRFTPHDIPLLVSELKTKSLMADSVWVDAALAYEHLARTTRDAHWHDLAVAALGQVRDRERGSYYFPQTDAAVRSSPLDVKDRRKLEEFCTTASDDWWISQLARMHGMPEKVDPKKISARGRAAERSAEVGGIILDIVLLAGIALAWPAWRIFNVAASESVRRRGDAVRHLRRLWAPAPAVLCFSLAGFAAFGVGKGFEKAASLLSEQFPASAMQQVGWPVFWLLASVFTYLTKPAAMRWCMAPDGPHFFRVFDVRFKQFKDRRWWLCGAIGSCLLSAVFLVIGWSMEKAGFDSGAVDRFSRSTLVLGKAGLPVMLVLGVVVAPVVEEVLYRGFIFSAFRNQFGTFKGAVAASAIFAIGHLYGGIGTLEVFLMGLALCYFYARTRSLVPGMILHACINLLSISLVWLRWSMAR